MDLIATHHTNEIAQSQACNHCEPVKYWMHTNMLTVNGVRMSKSAGNGFLPMELFTGEHKLLEKGYSPMAVKFFMLQTHYRSTLDFSNEALQASEKGFERLMNAVSTLGKLNVSGKSSVDIKSLQAKCYAAMNDDFNSPILLAHLFDGVKIINSIHAGTEIILKEDLDLLKKTFQEFIFDVLGLKEERVASNNDELASDLMNLILEIRNEAKAKKDFPTSDKIRDGLAKTKISIKDSKEGTTWELQK
jgi:cysteinyl-tRNA synthetase